MGFFGGAGHRGAERQSDGRTDCCTERYTERPGGYLRVLKTTERALGDASPRSLLGFVGGEEGPAKPAAEA